MDMLVDLVAGGASGVVTAAVGYPLDTVKVLMQNYGGTYFHGYKDCVTKVYQQHGLAGFYSGVPARLTSSMIEYSLTFGGYYGAMRLAGADVNNPTWWQIAIGGAGGGLATTAVLTPLELVKCTMQAADVSASSGAAGSRAAAALAPKNSWDCVRLLYARGGVRGLYQGGVPMLVREVPGTALWCGANDRFRYWLTPTDQSTVNLPIGRSLLAGGLSGVVYTVCVYPFDVLKTRIQVDPGFRKLNLWQAVQRQYKEGGVRALYRGFGMVAVFCFPASALTFGVFQTSARCLSSTEKSPERFSTGHVHVEEEEDRPGMPDSFH